MTVGHALACPHNQVAQRLAVLCTVAVFAANAQTSYILLDAARKTVIAIDWRAPDVPVPVGSLVKPFTAITYGQRHRMRFPVYECTGENCWLKTGHGRIGLAAAIAHSCNSRSEPIYCDYLRPAAPHALSRLRVYWRKLLAENGPRAHRTGRRHCALLQFLLPSTRRGRVSRGRLGSGGPVRPARAVGGLRQGYVIRYGKRLAPVSAGGRARVCRIGLAQGRAWGRRGDRGNAAERQRRHGRRASIGAAWSGAGQNGHRSLLPFATSGGRWLRRGGVPRRQSALRSPRAGARSGRQTGGRNRGAPPARSCGSAVT